LVCVFGSNYFLGASYTAVVFFITIMLAMIYGAMGQSTEPILLLRLEETGIGALAALAAVLLVLPVRTRDHVRDSGVGVLQALAELVRVSVERLASGSTDSPVACSRALDRKLRDLRTALRPVRARRSVLGQDSANRAFPALLACAHWGRSLAHLAESASAPLPDAEALLAESRRLQEEIAALCGRITGKASVTGPASPGPFDPLRPSGSEIAGAVAALNQIREALSLVQERIGDGSPDSFTRVSM
jgi:uncharacterized membrane protein YccC